tara:strand:+ start:237 stop:1430 length:1194 start_codon:yes stop_codon:yes gene_type:complete
MPEGGGNFADLQNQEFDWGGDAPSSFDFGNMSAPDDWLAFLESGEFSDFTMPQDTMVNLGSVGEGTQTVDWNLGGVVGDDNFGGLLGGTGYQDFSGEDIASMIAQMGLQSSSGQMGMEAINFYESFEDQFGDMFSNVTWGSGVGTSGGDMSNLSQLYAQEEADLWSSYDNWMSGQYSLLEQQYGNIYSDYTEGLESITDARTQSLKDLIENRRQQELNLTDELTSGTRAAGRGGFGTTGRQTDSLSQAQNILSAGTTGAYDIMQTSEAAMESLLQGTENQAALLYNQFALSAESEQLNINQQLQLMGTEFEMESESIYSDWLDSLMNLTSEIITSEAELNLPGGFEFNPFGEAQGCPPGMMPHPGTGECVYEDSTGGRGEITPIDNTVSDQLFDTEA